MNNTNEAVKMFDTFLQIQTIDDNCIQKSRELFIEYKNKGIIRSRSGAYDDNRWYFTDEYSNISMNFVISKFYYKKYYEPILDLTNSQFVEYLKAYVMISMGDKVLDSIRVVLYDINRLLKYNPLALDITSERVFIQYPNRIIDFFSMLPESSNTDQMEQLFNVLDCILDFRYSASCTDNKRALASFDSYFLFNDIMNDYWSGELSRDERLFFYPLYLWWKISGVIPLRPREFLLTPRNCLNKKNDGWYLTLRRNQLKGSNKKVTYKIEDDYYTVQYHIPDKLADEIVKYIDYTKEYDSTELETLFITDTHYLQWSRKKNKNSRYFTYVNMNCVMRYFYNDVVVGKYGLKIVYNREITYLDEGYINYLYLGDTRHLALINIIAEGGTPVIAMMLAGHNNTEMAAHYYSNISSLIECRTYKQYRKVLKGSVTYEISHKGELPLGIKDFVTLEDKSRCYSPRFFVKDYTDCKYALGPHGEIGYCPDCMYNRKNTELNFFESDNIYKKKIEDDCKQLAQIVKEVRNTKGNYEDILQAMLNLQNSSYSYQQYYEEKIYLQKENKNG